MAESTTLTIRLDTELKDKLHRLANATQRSKSFVAEKAVRAFVDRELEIVEGIQRAMHDIDEGRTIPHDAAMDMLDAAIEAMALKGAAKRRVS